jgi:hypothetical protein
LLLPLERQPLRKKVQTAKSNAASKANASEPMSRDEAIQKCNVEAAKFSYRDFRSTNLAVYRDCMARHGQSSE